MRAARMVVVGGASAAILTAGAMAAPQVTSASDQALADDPAGEVPGADSTAEATPAEDNTEAPGDATPEVFAGPVVTNVRGDYQVQITVQAGTVTEVSFPVAGTSASASRLVNEQALPVLREQFLEAQTWDVEYVSGASFTSPAMIESAQGAFEDAGL